MRVDWGAELKARISAHRRLKFTLETFDVLKIRGSDSLLAPLTPPTGPASGFDMNTPKWPLWSCIFGGAALLLISACSSTPVGDTSGSAANPGLTGSGTFSTALAPPGAIIKQDKSFTVGNGENWYGKLTLDIGKDDDIAYRFFIKTYPEKGWTLVSTVRSEQTQLVFTRPDRSATVGIVPANFWGGGTATIVISPSQNH